MAHQEHLHQEMRQCIQNCLDCHSICLETVTHCLQRGGQHAGPGHIRLLLDCAQICQTSADFMLRLSPWHPHTCGVCADICRRCAIACAQLGADDGTMQRCADVCRHCAESCLRMAGPTTGTAVV
jgi:hypothetical protein